MKAYGIPCLILALLLVGCFANSALLTARCEDWLDRLDAIDALAQQEAWEAAGQQTEELYGDWQQVQTWLRITIEHDALDGAESLFCRALALAEEEDSVEFRAHIADLRSALQLLCEMEQVRVENIL